MNQPEEFEDQELPAHPSTESEDAPSAENAEESDAIVEKASGAARKLEPILLAHLSRQNYQPVKPKVIAKQLNLASEQHQALKLAIKRLVKQGKAIFGAGHLVKKAPPGTKPVVEGGAEERAGRRAKPAATSAASKGDVIGKFRRASAGFGFVRPAGTPRGSDRSFDIFIPQKSTRDAADGDTVRVRLSRGKARGKTGEIRQSGEVLEVIERGTHQFVGVYRERGGEAFVEVDGKMFAQPIAVGDPGAKNAQPGDKVVLEMVRFPTPMQPGEAVITEVLGARGSPGVDTLSILREFELPEEFSEEVLAASREEADKFDESLGNRLDLTDATIITIDPVDARDFDDAISLERLENGHWKVGVHIADVSHFVRPRSPLDQAAKDRATSIYLPDRVIPMLPEIISNNLASLQPNKVRYTQTAFIEFTPDGAPVATDFQLSAIKSKRRFTYEEVDEFLANREAWKPKLAAPIHALLGEMHELAMILRQRRLKGGAIELTLPEVKIDLDKQGQVVGAHLVKNTESHQMIEEFMLAANEAVARLLSAKGLHFLRRIHEQPALKKLDALTAFVRELGVECESLESRHEIKRVIAAVAGKPESHAVNYAVLRSMQKAVYGPIEEGHYALHSQHYCHFTSPIRRYPDLTIHRLLAAIARGKKPVSEFDELLVLGDHCSEREQRAQIAERELTKVKLLAYLGQRIGKQLDAVITGVEEFGLFAQGIELPAEGLIHVESLGDDFYRFDRASHTLVGYRQGNRFRLGDVIRVEVAHVDIDGRELNFRLVRRVDDAPRRQHGQSTRRPQGERERGNIDRGQSSRAPKKPSGRPSGGHPPGKSPPKKDPKKGRPRN